MSIPVSYLITHIKQPAEVLPIEISFGKLHILPRGAKEIVSTEAKAKKWPRKFPDDVEEADEFLVSTEPMILNPNKTSVRFTVTGGEDDHDYQVSILVTFDNGAKLEEEVFVRVREE